MASRHVIQQQNAGEVVGAANKQKNGGAERKNRRALGDIGNLVTIRGVDGKPLPPVTRPVTRSFCAQLLANAQAAAVDNNNNKNIKNGALPEKRAAARKPAQKKPAIKPKPEEIIEISPDTIEEKAKEKSSVKKKAPTLTSTLTARSKAACGITSKPKEQIIDIDADDLNNDLAVVEYIDDMYTYYKSAENEGRAHDYMSSQPELNEKMRAILVDWLVQVHLKFELSPETFYLTINIVDRYLASKPTSRRELQLVGLSSMLIASKYEEIWAPEVNELVCISDRTYSHKQVLVMEKRILGELEWNLTVPTPYVFLVRFVKASSSVSDDDSMKVENLVYFLAELGMMSYAAAMRYGPSMMAAAAVYAARATVETAPFWNETLKLHTGFEEGEVVECARMLVGFHGRVAEEKLRGVYRKYMVEERGAVSLLPPAKCLLAGGGADVAS